MKADLNRISELEQINSLATKQIADVTPGLEVIVRDDVLLLSSQTFPTPDYNQACLVRVVPNKVDSLIDEVIEYFQTSGISPTFYISPACTPEDLPQRLLMRGFQKIAEKESWFVFPVEQLEKKLGIDNSIVAKRVEKENLDQFSRVMAAAFGLPMDWVDGLSYALEPSLVLEGVDHYLGYKGDIAVATITLLKYQDYVILGSAGVLSEYRGTRAIYNLTYQAVAEAKKTGAKTVISQTTLGPVFERFLGFCGFDLIFKRTGYTLT